MKISGRSWFFSAGFVFLSLSYFPSPSSGCGFDRVWMEDWDTLSFLEPSVVGVDLFNDEYLFHSRPLGLKPDDSWEWRDRNMSLSVDQANVQEWQTYLSENRGLKVGRKAVIDFVYRGDISWRLKSRAEWFAGESSEKGSLAGLSKLKDVEEYLAFAVKANGLLDAISSGSYDQKTRRWIPYQGDAGKELSDLVREAELSATRSGQGDFLTAKYGYQLVRIASFLGWEKKAHLFFGRFVGKTKEAPFTRFRALGYRAKADLGKGNRTRSLQTYLDIIDQCPPLRWTGVQSILRTFNRRDFQELAKIQANPHKLTTLYYAMGLLDVRDHSADSLKMMLTHGAGEAQTEAAFLQGVQKIEIGHMLFDRFALLGLAVKDWKKEEKNPYVTSQRLKRDKYLGHVQLCEMAATNPAVRQPLFWWTMGAYLSLLQGDPGKAKELLAKGKKLKVGRKVLNSQYQLVGTLVMLAEAKGPLPEDLQKRLVIDLEWARGLKEVENNHGLYHSLLVLLGQKYLVQGDAARSALVFDLSGDGYKARGHHCYAIPFDYCAGTANFILDAVANEGDLKGLQKILGAAKQPLDRYFASRTRLKADDVQLIRTVKFLRQGNHKKALELALGIPKGYLKMGQRTNDWNIAKYKKSDLIPAKIFSFLPELEWIDPGAKAETLDLVGYIRMIQESTESFNRSYEMGSPDWPGKAYRLAAVFSTQSLTGWPEIRRPLPAMAEHTYDPQIIRKFPLGIPGTEALMGERYQGFLAETENYNKKALGYCRLILDKSKDREMIPRALLGEATLSLGSVNDYDPSRAQNKKILKRIRDEYSNTKFYGMFSSWCESLKYVDKP